MEQTSAQPKRPEFDMEDMRYFAALSPREKLNYLEKMLLFLQKITPQKSKDLAKKLKELGF